MHEADDLILFCKAQFLTINFHVYADFAVDFFPSM